MDISSLTIDLLKIIFKAYLLSIDYVLTTEDIVVKAHFKKKSYPHGTYVLIGGEKKEK